MKIRHISNKVFSNSHTVMVTINVLVSVRPNLGLRAAKIAIFYVSANCNRIHKYLYCGLADFF